MNLKPICQAHATHAGNHNTQFLNPSDTAQNDLDLGSSGAVVIKDKYIMTGGKQGPLYLADAANLGGYSPATNNANAFQARRPISGYFTSILNDPPLYLTDVANLSGYSPTTNNANVFQACPQSRVALPLP